jgi:hypothetical protein
MDQARLQGSNLGCSEEGREILAMLLAALVPRLTAQDARVGTVQNFIG